MRVEWTGEVSWRERRGGQMVRGDFTKTCQCRISTDGEQLWFEYLDGSDAFGVERWHRASRECRAAIESAFTNDRVLGSRVSA